VICDQVIAPAEWGQLNFFLVDHSRSVL
jgi:hypothetical protein